MRRGGTPHGVASLILCLAGEQSSCVHGALINVSGDR